MSDAFRTAQVRYGLTLTQAEFAALLGHAVPTIARWEAGRARPCPASRALMEELQAQVPANGESRQKVLDFLRTCSRGGGYRALIGKALSASFDRYAHHTEGT
jgi:transcriptional regulator with XRE-family HTH domain